MLKVDELQLFAGSDRESLAYTVSARAIRFDPCKSIIMSTCQSLHAYLVTCCASGPRVPVSRNCSFSAGTQANT
eukprot:773588-Rhodomonas_salina.3